MLVMEKGFKRPRWRPRCTEGCTKLHENDGGRGSNDHLGIEVKAALWTLTKENRNESLDGFDLQDSEGKNLCNLLRGITRCAGETILFLS